MDGPGVSARVLPPAVYQPLGSDGPLTAVIGSSLDAGQVNHLAGRSGCLLKFDTLILDEIHGILISCKTAVLCGGKNNVFFLLAVYR